MTLPLVNGNHFLPQRSHFRSCFAPIQSDAKTHTDRQTIMQTVVILSRDTLLASLIGCILLPTSMQVNIAADTDRQFQ